MQNHQTALDKYGFRVPEWAAAVGTSRSSVYELLKRGEIKSVRFGGQRIIVTHPRDFLASLTSKAA
jgi:excisionase family DNA binding protein